MKTSVQRRPEERSHVDNFGVTVWNATGYGGSATGVGVAVLEALQVNCFVCSAVVDEAIYIRSDDPAQPREAVSIAPWLLSGAVDVTSPNGSLEEELYVQLGDLDDGEAMSLAICRARGYALAADDRKARRIAGQLALPSVQLLSTSQIFHHRANRTGAAPVELKRGTILYRGCRAAWSGGSAWLADAIRHQVTVALLSY